MSERRFLGYCGMYCGDCLGNTGVIANAAEDFLKVLDKHEFERTVEGVFSEQLVEYDTFIDVLEFMGGLRCKTMCREVDGGESTCIVRQCAVDNGFHACNECKDFEACDKLADHLGTLHIESSRNNLRAINRMGLDEWLEKGKKYIYGDHE
jgi:hypothetical protein